MGLAIKFYKFFFEVCGRCFCFILNNRIFKEFLFSMHQRNSYVVANTKFASFVLNVNDQVIGRSTFVKNSPFDSEKFETVVKLLPPNHSKDLLMDVGANVGTISIYAVGSGIFSKAFAFEPEPKNFKLLQVNVLLNDLEQRVFLENIALSSTTDSHQLLISDSNYGDHRIVDHVCLYDDSNKTSLYVDVKCDLLDSFSQIVDKDSTLVWIDTQGYEGFVLAGARIILSKQVPICLEFWPFGLDQTNCKVQLIDIIVNAGYSYFIDLRYPDRKVQITTANLVSLADSLAGENLFTDILII